MLCGFSFFLNEETEKVNGARLGLHVKLELHWIDMDQNEIPR